MYRVRVFLDIWHPLSIGDIPQRASHCQEGSLASTVLAHQQGQLRQAGSLLFAQKQQKFLSVIGSTTASPFPILEDMRPEFEIISLPSSRLPDLLYTKSRDHHPDRAAGHPGEARGTPPVGLIRAPIGMEICSDCLAILLWRQNRLDEHEEKLPPSKRLVWILQPSTVFLVHRSLCHSSPLRRPNR